MFCHKNRVKLKTRTRKNIQCHSGCAVKWLNGSKAFKLACALCKSCVIPHYEIGIGLKCQKLQVNLIIHISSYIISLRKYALFSKPDVIFFSLGFDLTPDAGTSLRKITKYGIDHLLPSFEIISIGANKELKLQMDLADMLKQWETIEFPITLYKDTDIKVLGNIEDIQVRQNIVKNERKRIWEPSAQIE